MTDQCHVDFLDSVLANAIDALVQATSAKQTCRGGSIAPISDTKCRRRLMVRRHPEYAVGCSFNEPRTAWTSNPAI